MMKFKHSAPILCSANVAKSIAYYTEILGFESSWTWEDPPSFGGVRKDGIELFFCLNGQGQPGTWLAISVSDVDEYYKSISAKGARVLHVPADREWGVREMLVRDPDNHIIRFGQSISIRKKSEASIPSCIRIVRRKPTPEEYQRLVRSVRWNEPSGTTLIENILAAPVFAVVAEDISKNEAIGCVLLLGDRASFYYVKDVIVHPDWQNKRIGTAIMQEVNDWLETNAPDQSLVGLYTGDNLAPFYRQFNFRPSFGMMRRITGNRRTNRDLSNS
jgi:catechol 2,3-dioxygenase-like lactoylglutathione lyase family enzyme/GNAT superfamily N-acetyltransferase